MQHNRKTDTLYNLIEQNPRVLEEIDLIPFVETPLHVAARAGHLQFANEIMILKPSFEAFEFLLRWLTTNPVELQNILNQTDVEGNTTLHIAATKNDTKLSFKSLIIIRVIYVTHWKVVVKNILSVQAMKLLIKVMSDLHASNLMGQRAFDIINNQEIRNNLVRTEKRDRMFRKGFSLIDTAHEWIIRKTGMKEKMSNEIRNTYMIVATLIATTTYQSVLSPGGFRQVDEGGTNTTLFLAQGTSVMSDTEFMAFSTANLFAFTTSILTITWLMPKNVGWYLLYVSTWFLAISYLMSIMIISPNDFTAELMVSFYDVLLPVLAVVSFLFFKLT
ncbi:ankyrin repeat-containing protein BDA1-like [Phaseolus vulgaris]|uniref:ankyrin repeat-containing protein BDA1-like n=1 Tax=Phaseolus vulgaris TaxID=3885 RepID=UPI0035CB1385